MGTIRPLANPRPFAIMTAVQPTNGAAWLRVWILASCLCAACEGPGRQIVLEPLGERPPARDDEDAGPEVPDGSIACKRDSDCDDKVYCTVDVCVPQGYCESRIDNTQCSDGLVCNGTESCDPVIGGCVSG